MYYQEYLSNLCQRRQWPEPIYRLFRTGPGFVCVARVNNREYQTDTIHESERLAQENAAMRAYLICQNFSKSDGMYPTGHKGRRGGDVVQGLPVAIGTERMSVYTDDSRSSGSRSGGSSPTTAESGHFYGSSYGSQTYGGQTYGSQTYGGNRRLSAGSGVGSGGGYASRTSRHRSGRR